MQDNLDKLPLQLPRLQLAARIDCYGNDEIECSLNITEFQLLSLNLFDAKNCKFFIKFNAKLSIEFWRNGRQESLTVTAEDYEFSSADEVGDLLHDMTLEDATFYLEDLSEIFGEQTIVSFYIIEN